MLRFIRDRYVWYAAILIAIVAIFTYIVEPNLFGAEFEASAWHPISVAIRNFICLAIVAFSSWRLGYKGGFVTCLAIVLISLPHIVTEAMTGEYSLTLVVEYMMFVPTGVATAWLFGTLKKTKTKLKDSEVRYRRLFETAQDAILILNGDTGQIIDANPFIKDLLGLSIEELIGKNLWEIGEFKDILASKISYQELHESGYKRWNNLPFVAKDGRIVSIEVIANAYEVDHTRVIQCNIRDMTAANLATEALQQSEACLLATLDSTNDGILAVDDNGKVVNSNRRFAEMWHIPSDMIEQHDDDVLLAFVLDQLVEPGIFLTRVKQLYSVDQKDFDTLRFKDGRIFERYSRPLVLNKASSGRVWSFRDVTESTKAEETIKLQAELLDKELDSVYLTDFEGNLIYVNKAAWVMHGYTREELLNMNLKNLDDTESAKLIAPRLKEIFEKGEVTFEVNHFHKNGSLIPLEIHASKIEVSGKQVILSVAHDITGRRKVQQQLMAQDRLASIGQLVSGVAHELNNPLTSVIGFSELLLQRELPDDVKADLKIVNDEAKRTSLIVKNLLTFARQQPQDKRVIDINEPIKSVLQVRRHEQSANNIKVNIHLAPDLPQIMGNGSQLQQVFFNIVTNAEQAMLEAHKMGTLTITTEQVGSFVRASFTDDGPGITKENTARLFSPFFTTKGVGKGTGLGLSISHGIIAEHGGRIWAESEPGKGTTFIIELPVWNGAIS